MKKTLLTLAGAAALVTAALAARPATAMKRFDLDTIKAWTGEWVSVAEDGSLTDQVVSKLRPTAAGSAMLELLFEGDEHEMVTLYHMEGDDLILTHYCMLGNQPRMKARSEGDKLVFECDGNASLDCRTAKHMHRGEITMKGDDRMSTSWYLYENGETNHTEKFELARKR